MASLLIFKCNLIFIDAFKLKTSLFSLDYNLAGFMSEEEILFRATVENQSKISVKNLSIGLYQSVKFVSRNKIKTCVKKKASVDFNNKIYPDAISSWHGSLRIPAVYSSTLDYCKIILIEYFVCMAIKTSILTRNVYLNIPIKIVTQAIK
jgi:hypothetical protein